MTPINPTALATTNLSADGVSFGSNLREKLEVVVYWPTCLVYRWRLEMHQKRLPPRSWCSALERAARVALPHAVQNAAEPQVHPVTRL